MKEKYCQLKILYPVKLFLKKNEGEIKIFLSKEKLKEFVSKRPALKELPKEIRKQRKWY